MKQRHQTRAFRGLRCRWSAPCSKVCNGGFVWDNSKAAFRAGIGDLTLLISDADLLISHPSVLKSDTGLF